MSLIPEEQLQASRERYLREHPEDRAALRHEDARIAQKLILAVREFPDITIQELVEHSGRPALWIRRTLTRAGIKLHQPTLVGAVKTRTQPKSARQEEAAAKAQQTKIAQAQAQMFWRAQIQAQAKPAAEDAAAVAVKKPGFVYQPRPDAAWEARMNPRRTRQARMQRRDKSQPR